MEGLAIKHRKSVGLDTVTVRNGYEEMEWYFPNFFDLAVSVFETVYRVGLAYHSRLSNT